jgi:alpha-soluble NSF attachment protein
MSAPRKEIPAEAQELLKEAEKLASKKSSSGFLSFFTGSTTDNIEEAAELYTRAGNLLKAEGCWREAANAFLRSAELTERDQDGAEEGARKRINAASCFRKIDAESAIAQLELAIGIYVRAGRFHLVATYEKECGEIWESASRWKECAEYFEKAARRYEAEDSPAMAQGCFMKAALALGWLGEWQKAATLYENMADDCAADSTRKFNQKEFVFRCILCHLANDDQVAASKKVSLLERGRELQLVKALLDAIEQDDLEKFNTAVSEYDQVASLDDWKINVLTAIKKSLEQEESLA